MRFQNLAFVAALLYSQQSCALSNITYYSDDLCTDVVTEKNAPDDGTCTQFPTMSRSYASFRVSSLDQTCSVTIYGNDTAFCSSTINLKVAPFGDCITDMSVNQFSVDCQDYSVAISSPPNIFAGADSTPVEDSNGGGLSGGAKAGIGVAAAAFVIILVGLIVFLVIRNNRRKRQNVDHDGIAEADSTQAAAPPYSELPPDSEKKRPVELPPQQMIPVEAPGDHAWPTQELEAAVVESKIMALTHQASHLKSLNRRQSDSDITPVNASVNGDSTTSMSNSFSPVSPEDTATNTSSKL
ncbi:uncharacterized protein A1O9_09260 [Exophiala aquamarina CBS 119918]|uniref:Mid2 domain-containing protein n=1 Tax=Exophiala aquamarina CBS 119918 TaxID=1182545 RepID=A0A072P6C9_9EURO|nr:uncharacterized protein A1O9_09260 [Exophiala aquamarina CBS 119918]KEF54818.1 hypothetical protein A1O9_09260 [Exophiala aquamarina CBS 119918]